MSSGEEEQGSAEAKIVGGSDATISAFPHQVALMDSSFFQFCGGTILNENWVVTANHCVEGTSAASLRVGAGASRLSAMRSGGQLRSVAQIVRYPGYVSPDRGRDVALLRLAAPLDLSGPNARAISLVSAADAAGDTATGTVATVTGWGTLSAGGASPDLLQSVAVNVVSQATLTQQYGATITADQLGAAAPGKDSCQGDSGGPLVVGTGATRKLAGVVSWGNGCADARFAGVYARVSSFEGWIRQQIGGAVDPGPQAQTLLDRAGLAAARNTWTRFTVTVPSGAPSMTIVTQGGVGDADLYVRFGAQPTTTAYTCRPFTDGNNETCTFSNPSAGTWHIAVRGYAAFSGVALRATLP